MAFRSHHSKNLLPISIEDIELACNMLSESMFPQPTNQPSAFVIFHDMQIIKQKTNGKTIHLNHHSSNNNNIFSYNFELQRKQSGKANVCLKFSVLNKAQLPPQGNLHDLGF